MTAVRICQELFHLLYWLARTYTRLSDPKDLDVSFNPELLKPQHIKAQTQACPIHD